MGKNKDKSSRSGNGGDLMSRIVDDSLEFITILTSEEDSEEEPEKEEEKSK